MKPVVRFGLVVAAAVAVASCSPRPQNNIPCTLVKKDPSDPTGQRSVFIYEPEISANASRDVISFGAVECEDLVCIREGGAPIGNDPSVAVAGWCSKPCLEGQTNACPSNDPALDKDPATAMSCRKLLLDEEALNSLRQTDPTTYKRYFGDTQSPFFCARTVVTPAGP